MNPKLSVIVPVYNTLPYLQTCFDSIKRQDYEPLEVILVDDGSTDGSSEFCDEYAMKDSRFKVIHKENGGQSSARNLGLDNASGDYITFVDSDDALVGQPYSFLITVAKKECASIVCMKCLSIEQFRNEKDNILQNYSFMTGRVFFSFLCKDDMSAVWDKVFDRNLFRERRFSNSVSNEDFLILSEMAFENNLTIVSTEYCGYFHRATPNSVSNSGFGKAVIDAVYNAEYVVCENPYTDLQINAETHLLNRIFFFLVGMPKQYISSKQRDYLNVLRILKHQKKKIKTSECPRKTKLFLNFFLVSPMLAKRIADYYLENK